MVSVFEYNGTKKELIANEMIENGEYTEIPIGSFMDNKNGVELTGFDRLGFSAGFKTLLKEYNVVEGTYGVRIEIIHGENNDTTNLYFDNTEMYGDTYNFKSYFSQEQIFDISGISNSIHLISIYLFQKSNFKDSNGKLIDYNGQKITDSARSILSNIFIDNIKIYLGYDVEKFSTDTILLYCLEDDLTYGANAQSEQQPKNILARWIHKDEEKGFICLKNIVNEFELRWYKQNPSATSDGYCGKGWKHLEEFNNSTEIAFIPSITEAQETLKTIGFVINQDGEKTYYPGESITFINSNYNVSQQQATAQTAAQIHCKDGTEGNYFIYNQNNKLNNNAEGTAKKRQFEFLWQGKKPTAESGLTSIKWILPYENTMIYLAEEDYKDWPDRGIVYEDTGKPYFVIEKKLQYNEDETNNLNDIILQDYSIRNTWSPSRGNNHIRCVATVKGIEYEAIEDLNFGKAGTTGTNATLVLEFEGEVALTAIPGDEITISAYLYNASGELIPWTDELKKGISWSWKDNSNQYINATFTEGGTTTKLVWPDDGQTAPDNNYSILQCTLPWSNHNDKTYDLVSYLPIPIKRNKYDSYIEGAAEILYDATGTPHYDKNVYKLFEKTNIEKVQGIEWVINAEVEDKYLPILKQNDNGVALSANPFFIKGSSDKVCVCCKDSGNGVVYWSQPILIMESQYGFSMLNSWDGTLQINENDGTIMSTMLGAGKKNSDNTFSGVLIGDVEKGTGNSIISTTGVYGLQDGMITYALTEDGKATFGKANGAGQIIIDGNEGTIQSGNYNKNSSGMKIDLEDGHIDAYNFKLTSSKILMDSSEDADTYFQIKDDEDNILINIGNTTDNKYYLQSSDGNSKFDLKKGEIELESDKGSILLSTQGNPYFQIQSKAGNNLIYMGENYYLESNDYVKHGDQAKNNQNELVYLYNKQYISKGSDDYYYINSTSTDNQNVVSYIKTSQKHSCHNSISDNDQELIAAITNFNNVNGREPTSAEITTLKSNIKNSRVDKVTNLKTIVQSGIGTGLHINLESGIINGYNLYLRTNNSSEPNSKYVLIDGGASDYPFRIGSTFKVDWDGSLTCNNFKYLGYGNQNKSDAVININDNFYVNSSGGGSWPGGSVGYSSRTGSATNAKMADAVKLGSTMTGDATLLTGRLLADGVIEICWSSYSIQDIIDAAKVDVSKFNDLYSDYYLHKHSTPVLGTYYKSGTPIYS